MKLRKYLFLGVLLFGSFYVQAQVGLYANFSTATVNVPDVGRLYGSTFGGYFDKGHLLFLGTGIDARGVLLSKNSTTFNSGLVGPRVSAHIPAIPLRPYVEALIGAGHVDVNDGSAQTSATKFEYQFLGGVDLTVLPHIDWRVVEFSYGGLSGLDGSFNPKILSTGIVIRLF